MIVSLILSLKRIKVDQRLSNIILYHCPSAQSISNNTQLEETTFNVVTNKWN